MVGAQQVIVFFFYRQTATTAASAADDQTDRICQPNDDHRFVKETAELKKYLIINLNWNFIGILEHSATKLSHTRCFSNRSAAQTGEKKCQRFKGNFKSK